MDNYRFDKSAFKRRTFEESDAQNRFNADVPYAERLRQAYFLIAHAYGFSPDNPPRLDRMAFRIRRFD